MTGQRSSRAYQDAVARLKARSPVQPCWSCGKLLYASAPKGHPLAITLGHYIALEDGGHLTDPSNHGPQCGKCNYGDGARRTNRKRSGQPGVRASYTNPRY